MRRLPWKKIVLFGPLGLLLLGVVVFAVGYVRTDVPEPSEVSQAQTTVIRYAGGEELARLGTNRVQVPLTAVSGPAQKAVLAAEDRGFYREPGISPKGIARALLSNLRGGGVQQGGSTITQQYAKNAFLTTERTYRRKIQEVFLALKMTREQSKEQILENYLNTIYFGRGAYGIEAASKAYFGQGASAATLTAAQGAVLASSIRSPAAYDPTRRPDRATERWAYVLDGMVGEGWLTAADRTATSYPAVIDPGSVPDGPDLSGPSGHVVEAVVQELRTKGFEESVVANGGLTVTLTIDKRAQDAAVAAVEAVTKGDRSDDALQGALVAVVPGTGAVRAYYGGANGSGLDYAGGVVPGGTVLRQPGSSMKPYVLAAALEDGMPLTTTLDGSSPRTLGGQTFRNFGGSSAGRVDLVTATKNSVNTAYVDLALQVGPEAVANLAHRAGIPSDVSLVNSETGRTESGIALGVYPVHVIDQASGFATFAAGGVQATPYVVATVVQDGETVYQGRPVTRQAFSREVAADATYAMQQVIASGSGTRARLAGRRPAAGKTGTTTEATDVWFCGFTPQLSAAVWFGYGRNSPVTVGGSQTTGGRLSTGVWKAFMDAALDGQPVRELPGRAYVGQDSSSEPAPTPSRRPSATPSADRSATPSPSLTASPSRPGEPGPTDSPAPTRTPAPAPTVPPAPSRTPGADPARLPAVAPASTGPGGG